MAGVAILSVRISVKNDILGLAQKQYIPLDTENQNTLRLGSISLIPICERTGRWSVNKSNDHVVSRCEGSPLLYFMSEVIRLVISEKESLLVGLGPVLPRTVASFHFTGASPIHLPFTTHQHPHQYVFRTMPHFPPSTSPSTMAPPTIPLMPIGARIYPPPPDPATAPRSVDEWNQLSYHESRERLLPSFHIDIRDYMKSNFTRINDEYIIHPKRPPKPRKTPVKTEAGASTEGPSSKAKRRRSGQTLTAAGSDTPSEDDGDNLSGYVLCLDTSDTIDEDDFERCFRLVERTSSAAYRASSGGWSAVKKRKEMELLDMKYLLLKSVEHNCRTGSVKGFLSFMITIEDEHEVLYIYELHLRKEMQGRGVGKWMMKQVEKIGRRAGLEKTMLSVFRSNEGARNFYEGLGYGVDEFSPGPRKLRGGRVMEPEYSILSKGLGDEAEFEENKDDEEDEDSEMEDEEMESGDEEVIKKEEVVVDRKIKVEDWSDGNDAGVKTTKSEEDAKVKMEEA